MLYLVVKLLQVASETLTFQSPLCSLKPFQQCGPLHQQVGHLFAGAAQAHLPKVLLSQHLGQLLALTLWEKDRFLLVVISLSGNAIK